MGYSFNFKGYFKLNKPLDTNTRALIDGLCTTRRVKIDMTKLGLDKGLYGPEGEFFFSKITQEMKSAVEFEEKPSSQPGIWCYWEYVVDSELGPIIRWNNIGKQFYESDKWIAYLIEKVLEPAGYFVNGAVEIQGDDFYDRTKVRVKDNTVIMIDFESAKVFILYKSKISLQATDKTEKVNKRAREEATETPTVTKKARSTSATSSNKD